MVSLCLALAFQAKTVNYDLFRNEEKIGTVKIQTKITQDGGKRSDSKIQIVVSGKTIDMHSTQVWAFSGKPTLKINQVFNEKGVERNRTRMDFKATEVAVTETIGDKVTKKSVPIPTGADIRNFAEFWFLRDEPEKGKSYSYQAFNSSTMKWEKATCTYIGETEKNIGGRKIKVQAITQQIGAIKVEIWLDTDGFAVLTESSDHTRIVATF